MAMGPWEQQEIALQPPKREKRKSGVRARGQEGPQGGRPAEARCEWEETLMGCAGGMGLSPIAVFPQQHKAACVVVGALAGQLKAGRPERELTVGKAPVGKKRVWLT